MDKYEIQRRQKAEGYSHREAQRREIDEFIAAYRSEHGHDPVPTEVAAHFSRSVTWFRRLMSLTIGDEGNDMR